MAVVVHEEPGDKAEDVAEAFISAKRLEQLKDIRARTLEARVPAAFFAVDREVSQLERGFAAKGPDKKKSNYVLRRAVEQASLKESAALVKKRESLLKLKLAAKSAEFKAAKAQVVAIAEKAARKVAKGKVLKLANKLKLSAAKKSESSEKPLALPGPSAAPKVYTASECAGKKKIRDRIAVLERLKVGAPALPAECELCWKQVRDSYARHMLVLMSSGPHGGALFVERVNKVVQALGCHFKGPSVVAKPATGGSDPEAFYRFFRSMRKAIPKSTAANV